MLQESRVNVLSVKQISIQKPLTEEWMTNPEIHTENFVRAIDPDFRQFISAGDARRLGKLLKRALATSLSALHEGGITNPDAIITGTGFGSVESTELFLEAMIRDGEQMLKPTWFMQSTHNTASSLIAIHTQSYGYNSTYTQKGLSFECALYDAWLQFGLGRISSALVGGHDEMTPEFAGFMRKAGHLLEGEICSEAAVSALLSTREQEGTKALCTVAGVEILDSPDAETLDHAVRSMIAGNIPDAVMTGMSGNATNDGYYHFLKKTLPEVPLLRYKHLFGVNFSSSAIAFYAAANCLGKGFIPSVLTLTGESVSCSKGILLINAVEGRHYSVILLKPLCGKL